jgi:hypothetical protein
MIEWVELATATATANGEWHNMELSSKLRSHPKGWHVGRRLQKLRLMVCGKREFGLSFGLGTPSGQRLGMVA